MKKLMGNNRGRFATALAILAVAFGLVACSGGGGGSTPTTPASVTVTCPNGTAQTAATTVLANAACPAPVMLSIDPANLGITSTPDSLVLTGIVVATDSVLDPASLTTANVTLKVGSLTTIAGTVSATDTKGFKFVPAAKLQYGQAYDFVADVKDALGKILAVRSSFSTSLISCTAPQVPDSTGTTCVVPPTACTAPAIKHATLNACIYPIGVQKSIPATELPASITSVTDTAFLSATVTGEVLLIDTGIKMTNYIDVADRTRDLVYAIYRQNGNYSVKPLFKDTLTGTISHDDYLNYALSGSIFDRVQGDINGLLIRYQPGVNCALGIWDTASIGFTFVASSACPAWN